LIFWAINELNIFKFGFDYLHLPHEQDELHNSSYQSFVHLSGDEFCLRTALDDFLDLVVHAGEFMFLILDLDIVLFQLLIDAL
jgi:hypothetical protein